MRELLLIGALFGAAPLLAGDDISKINSGIHIDAGESVGDLSTVNGGIRIDARAVAGSASTVNGGISLDQNAKAQSVETVNGGIKLAEKATVAQGASTVNGSIRLLTGSEVGGNVSSVNGTIRLERARVSGNVTTVSGDLLIGKSSKIEGGIKVKKPTSTSLEWMKTVPKVVIGPYVEIKGDLVFERQVDLHVHQSALIGKIKGAKAKPITSDIGQAE